MSHDSDDAVRPAEDASLQMRVGTTDRTAALDALGEHMAAGRISLAEYDERSAQAGAARTAADLVALFTDLPAPHPDLPGCALTPGDSSTVIAERPSRPPERRDDAVLVDTRSAAQKIVGAAAAVSVFVALALFFTTGSWLWFLLIPGVSGVASVVWGPDWREPKR